MTRGQTPPDAETADRALQAAPMAGRNLLLTGAAVVAAIVVALARWRNAALDYRSMEGLPPFRQLVSDGAISTASLALAGLQGAAAPDVAARAAEVRADPCAALFGAAGADGALPIAYFSDFNCPYCWVLEGDLADVLAADLGLRLVRHELPLLGAASASAARAVLAADLQGGLRGHEGAPRASRARHERAFPAHGLWPARPRPRSPAAGLGEPRGLAFGIVGMPALVIGRTLVVGAVSGWTIGAVVGDGHTMPAPARWAASPRLLTALRLAQETRRQDEVDRGRSRDTAG